MSDIAQRRSRTERVDTQLRREFSNGDGLKLGNDSATGVTAYAGSERPAQVPSKIKLGGMWIERAMILKGSKGICFVWLEMMRKLWKLGSDVE